MLFEALTARLPSLGDTYPALAHSHIYELPPHPSTINPTIDPAIAQVISTALMKNPLQRYQRASDMAEALERAIQSLPTGNERERERASAKVPTQPFPTSTDPSRVS